MLAQIITENGTKKLKPLTADAGAGNPVGTIIPMYKKSSPSGYLYCDGSTFDETKYPLLYAYLGSNVLPDYREFALVGAEENTTDVYNASTNPNGTIHDHDVFTQGQAKDDQIQKHTHSFSFQVQTGAGGSQNPSAGSSTGYSIFSSSTGENNGRKGDVTRGKRKAVYFYIKATSGLSENAQDNVINTLNEERSYSTEEVNTGKKWIDGKPIYRKVINTTASSAVNSWYHLTAVSNISNVAHYTDISGIIESSNGVKAKCNGSYYYENNAYFHLQAGYTTQGGTVYLILEYTKTTD